MSGILQTCPRCDARWVRLFWHINLHRLECTSCIGLSDADLRRDPAASAILPGQKSDGNAGGAA